MSDVSGSAYSKKDIAAAKQLRSTLIAQRDAIVATASRQITAIDEKLRGLADIIGEPLPDTLYGASDYFSRNELQGKTVAEAAVWGLRKIARPAKIVELAKVLSVAGMKGDLTSLHSAVTKALTRNDDLFYKKGLRWGLVEWGDSNGGRTNEEDKK